METNTKILQDWGALEIRQTSPKNINRTARLLAKQYARHLFLGVSVSYSLHQGASEYTTESLNPLVTQWGWYKDNDVCDDTDDTDTRYDTNHDTNDVIIQNEKQALERTL